MGFQKGHKLSGSRKGKPNKATKTVKDTFLEVFTKLQEDKDANLEAWSKENKTDFYKLCQKLIPAAIEAKIEGEVSVKQIFKIGDTEIEL